MAAYYNEIDPYAASWLRNLIAAGHIAPGEVDERDIRDVHPSDIREFTQCHFFAGIGVWSYALRRAGWSDDRSVWTGSCPCQPFSSAGAGLGFADERHLWPHWHHLISECRPAIILGEQVASKDASSWVDLVQDDLEALDFAFGAVPFPSASVGAPHIRDRLYWAAIRMGNSIGQGLERHRVGHRAPPGQWAGAFRSVAAPGESCRLADTDMQHQQPAKHSARPGVLERGGGAPCGMADGHEYGCGAAGKAERERTEQDAESCGADCRVADACRQQRQIALPKPCDCSKAGRRHEDSGQIAGLCCDGNTGPVNGFWRDADWLLCRDGKWRPVEPGTFPLAHGAPARVGRLRAYGNAINAEAARLWIETVMERMP